MEVEENFIKEKIKNIAFKEKAYFLNRREINWSSLAKCAVFALFLGVIGILLIPSEQESVSEFYEQAHPGERGESIETASREEPLSHFSGGGGYGQRVPVNLEHLYVGEQEKSKPLGNDLNSSMILARNGLDSKTQLPPGTRILVRLYEKAIVANMAMPVIGVVIKDYIHEDTLAIPKDSKLLGSLTFDDRSDLANVSWQSIQLPDGRERPFSAIGVGTDRQVGVKGHVHSEALKNTIGQTLTRFVGAYAEGSMQRGVFGQNPGGTENGLRNAVAETARDRADSWASDLRREKRWIEVSNQTEFYAVLTANFAFRDPGSTYGR